jgi:signal transduction histidine kinase
VPRTIAGRVLLAAAVTLVAVIATLALLLPIVLEGYGPQATPGSIGQRLVSAVIIAAIVGGIVAVVGALAIARTLAAPAHELADRAATDSMSSAGWSLPGAPAEMDDLASVLRRVAAKAAERQTAAEAQRRRIDATRRDFVANVSHELRTPIASLKAMAEALESGAMHDPAAARDFISRMRLEIDEMAQLVSELLTLARIESGAEAMEPAPVAPAEIVASASRLQPLAERAGVALEIAPVDGLPAVMADRERIGQVLADLVHNAVKFTPRGGRVTVAAEREPRAVRFIVRDTGIGIAREEQGRVFERFYKGERSRAGSGTGLGLAIARHIVEAHGGTLGVESEGPGRGSAFSFTLALADGARPPR